MIRAFGIDKSLYQGKLTIPQWNILRDDCAVLFAFIKASQGNPNGIGSYPDPTFSNCWLNSNNGILRGAYHYFIPVKDPTQQIADFLNIIGGKSYNGQLPPVIDHESRRLFGPELSHSLHQAATQIEAVTGRKPIFYTAKYVWEETVYETRFRFKVRPSWTKEYEIWTANHHVTNPVYPKDWNEWRFWQYSDNGRFSKFPNLTFDLNVFNGDAESLKAYAKGEIIKPERARVMVGSLFVRSGPEVTCKSVGALFLNQVATIYDTYKYPNDGDIWLKVSSTEEKWACMRYQGKILMRYLD